MTKIIKMLVSITGMTLALSATTFDENESVFLISHAIGSAACLWWWIWMFGDDSPET